GQVRRQDDFLLIERISQLQGEVFAQRKAEPCGKADRIRLVRDVAGRKLLPVEGVDAPRHAITEEVRIHVGDRQAFRVLAVLDRDLPEQPAAEQVAFGDADFAHESIRGRIAARNRKFTGRLLFDVDVENDAIGSRAWVGRYLDAFEITEVLEASLGPIYQRAIVGIAFHDVEFAADHVIARARIPADVDPLDIGALRLGDGEEEIDSARLGVARRAWAHRREGK